MKCDRGDLRCVLLFDCKCVIVQVRNSVMATVAIVIKIEYFV